MTFILKILQIKTIRSAWVLLAGSILMFLFGINRFVFIGEEIFFLFATWTILAGIFFAIALWSLFSKKGRIYLERQEQSINQTNRNLIWWFKFVFVCYIAATGTVALLAVLTMALDNPQISNIFSDSNGNLYFFLIGLCWSPIVFKYLK